MERSKIIENHYQKLQQEQPEQNLNALSKSELIDVIQKIVSDEIEKHLTLRTNACEPEFINIKEASVFLNLAVTTLYEKTSNKTIPFHKKDKKLYFKKEELTDWLMGTKAEAKIVSLPTQRRNKKNAA